jgi:signal transduction histidine kinase
VHRSDERALDSARGALGTEALRVRWYDSHPCCLREGDPLRLHQIVTNLVSNGIKFTPQSGRVEVRLERHGEVIRIGVTDTGRGIAPDLLPHVFARFRQKKSSMAGRAVWGLDSAS